MDGVEKPKRLPWGMKRCGICKEVKRRTTDFYRDKNRKGNAWVYCRECMKILNRVFNKDWYERNKEYKKQKVRERYQKKKEEKRLAALALLNPPPPAPPKKKGIVESAREEVERKKKDG
jgi:hypothetical protein